MMDYRSFTHDERALRVRVGDELVGELVDEVQALGSRALIIATPGRHEFALEAQDALGDRCVGVFHRAEQHVPRSSIESARLVAETARPDVLLSIGGGSATGLAKALVLQASDARPAVIAMPTTYSGSEATNIWGISEDGRKTTGRDPKVAPRTILYVPRWTTELPVGLSMVSGINAMAHCVEALYAIDRNPMTSLMAADGIRVLSESLAAIRSEPESLAARAGALWGAFLAGRALDASTMGLHHKLAHVVGGSFGMPHAPTHAIILPYATAYNAPAAPEAMERIAGMLGVDEAATGLFELNRELGVPNSLQAIGFQEADLQQVVDEVLEKAYPNPRPIEAEALLATLQDAWAGSPPKTHGEVS